MHEGSIVQQVLYLIVYSGALISASGTAAFSSKISRITGIRLLFIGTAACTSVLSAQVFINSSGIPEKLEAASAANLTLMLNMLIIALLSIIIYSSVSASLSLRGADYAVMLRKAAAWAAGAAVIPLLVSQGFVLFSRSMIAETVFTWLLGAGVLIFFAAMIFSNSPAVSAAESRRGQQGPRFRQSPARGNHSVSASDNYSRRLRRSCCGAGRVRCAEHPQPPVPLQSCIRKTGRASA